MTGEDCAWNDIGFVADPDFGLSLNDFDANALLAPCDETFDILKTLPNEHDGHGNSELNQLATSGSSVEANTGSLVATNPVYTNTQTFIMPDSLPISGVDSVDPTYGDATHDPQVEIHKDVHTLKPWQTPARWASSRTSHQSHVFKLDRSTTYPPAVSGDDQVQKSQQSSGQADPIGGKQPPEMDDGSHPKSTAAHSVVERRYREGLNGALKDLEAAVRHAEARLGPNDGTSHVGAGKTKKVEVLQLATTMIYTYEVEVRHLADEVARLNTQIKLAGSRSDCSECPLVKRMNAMRMNSW
jgi:hypothetical protein